MHPDPTIVTRRAVLAGGGAVVASTLLGTRVALASPETPAAGDVIVLVFLRGGMDGLSMVAPFTMPSYRTLRPTIRVKGPDEVAAPNAGLPLVSGGAVDPFALSGTFALHPGMAPLHQTAWADGRLAVVHAVGMPAGESATRSHFESMRNWEAGTASAAVTTGFLNRFLDEVDADRIAGIGRGSALQRSLAGHLQAYSMGSIAGFGVSGFSNNTLATDVMRRWYDDGASADAVTRVGTGTMQAVGQVRAVNWADPRFATQHGAVYPGTEFGAAMKEVASLIRAGIGLRAACVDLGGWDTHSDVGMPEDPGSYFRQRCAELAGGLAAFYRDLGPSMDEVTVATISEFGRTIDENGTGGCDHGRASAMLVMGGGIRGGVHGPFVPEIANGPEDDLAVLTDYRTVLAEVLTARGGAPGAGSIFPTWAPTAPLGISR